MERKLTVFPVEACALLAVFFTSDAPGALIGAAALLVISVLNACTTRISGTVFRNSARVILGVVYMFCLLAVCTALFGYGYQIHFAAVAIGLLASLPFLAEETGSGEDTDDAGTDVPVTDLKEAAFQAGTAAVIMIIAGVIREFFGAGSLFGLDICPGAPFVASFIGGTEIGLITAGIVLACVCAFCHVSLTGPGVWFVVIPAAVYAMISARGIGGIAKEVFILLIVCAALVSIRKRLVYSETGRPFRGMPVELVMTGLLYMVLSWI